MKELKKLNKETFAQKLEQRIFFSYYLGKIKIQFDKTVGAYRFGFTYYPRYKQFEINFGLYLLNFWYRETTNPWWKIW